MESSHNKQILFVGNHAVAHLGETATQTFDTYTFVQPGIREQRLPFLLHSSLGTIPCDSYDELRIKESALQWMDPSCSHVLVGDPTEWMVSGTIRAGIESNALLGVLFIYPVGMVAMDMRKELAGLILSLKKNNIPTYLIREPQVFFEAVEPNVNAFVQSSLGEGILPETLEYLCGHPSQFELG
ncbi:MAG: hypothetical protein ACKO4K_09650 [Flavobacteriales bacterium]